MRIIKVFILILFFIFLYIHESVTLSQPANTEQIDAGKGKLEIWFRFTSTPMTEREIYFHICRIYINNKAMGESAIVDKGNKWIRLFSLELEDGIYNIRIINGYASKDGRWAGEFSKQPKSFQIEISKGPATVMKYSYNVGLLKDDYVYDSIPPPPRIPSLKIPNKIKPRIMVVIPEHHNSRYIPDPATETALIKIFVENNFLVVDQTQVKEIRYNDESKKALQGDDEAATAIGRQFDSEILIIGEAISENIGLSSQGLIQCSARAEARAIKVDTGQILATHGLTSIAADASEDIASKKAFTQVGSELGRYLVQEITKKWTSESLSSIRVKISNVDFRQLVLFEQMIIQKFEGIQGFHRRSFDVVGKIAEIDVDAREGAQWLSSGLATREFPDFEVEILNFTANTLDLRLKKKTIMPSDIALRPKSLIFIENTKPDGTDKTKIKIMVAKVDETQLEYDWVAEKAGGSPLSGSYSIKSFDKNHDYEADWGATENSKALGTFPWVSSEVLKEIRDSGFTTIAIDRTNRKDTIVMAELKGVTTFNLEINSKKVDLEAIQIQTDKGDKLLILDDLQNPLVLSADVAGLCKIKVIAIYIPGYKTRIQQ